MMILWWGIMIALYWIFISSSTRALYHRFIQMGWTSINYRGESIVQSFGFNLFIHFFLYLVFLHLFSNLFNSTDSASWVSDEQLLFIFFILSLTIIGWYDDHYGTPAVKGLKGHLKAFFYEHKITSGFIKALCGTLVSILISIPYSFYLWDWFLSSILLMFSIHFFNLLDVRPGRTIKIFWFFLLLLGPWFQWVDMLQYVLPILLSTFILFKYDRRQLAMLGDTGSNVIGGIVGYFFMRFAPVEGQVLFLLLLMGLSIFAEKHSFTAYINKTPWLSKLDKMGVL